ncbi:hypothetical protein BV25DRAFT_1917929 [Artomyces pyxidatus]|uniref:Uncharacterized protein n=1 Tax=Artomyces pyxidatus TaxID=48021 RepID=A0ACB8SWT6_9AGAM|nr:hypothetical protein BV25DRAFT_1917929 [Artomyces pyxidatus]
MDENSIGDREEMRSFYTSWEGCMKLELLMPAVAATPTVGAAVGAMPADASAKPAPRLAQPVPRRPFIHPLPLPQHPPRALLGTPIESLGPRFEYPFTPEPGQKDDSESSPFSSSAILPPFSRYSKFSPPLPSFRFLRPPPAPTPSLSSSSSSSSSMSFHYTASPPTPVHDPPSSPLLGVLSQHDPMVAAAASARDPPVPPSSSGHSRHSLSRTPILSPVTG